MAAVSRVDDCFGTRRHLSLSRYLEAGNSKVQLDRDVYLVMSDDDFNPAQWKIYDPVCTSAHVRVRVPLPSIKNPPFSSAPVLLIIGTSL